MSNDDPRLSALYRRAPRSEPGADSDAAILRAAHAATPRRPRRSYVPWAVAATLVLGVGISWRVLQMPAPMDGLEYAQPELSQPLRKPAPQPAPPASSLDRADAVSPPRDAAVSEAPAPLVESAVLPAPAPAPASTAPAASRVQPAPKRTPAPAAQREQRKQSDVSSQFGKALGGQLFESSPDRKTMQSTTRMAPAQPLRRERASEAAEMSDADAEMAAQQPMIDCATLWLPDEATEAQWQATLLRARLGDDVVRTQCLEARYRELFGEPPSGAVSKPMPGK